MRDKGAHRRTSTRDISLSSDHTRWRFKRELSVRVRGYEIELESERRTKTAMGIVVSKKAIEEASKKLSNWGRWGKDDQIGTLNHVTPEDIVKAASLIRTGKVFALGIPLDRTGPQTGLFGGRFNPIHQMLATGTDAVAGQQDWNKIRYADDTLTLCVQGATHWDALGDRALRSCRASSAGDAFWPRP
jgi:hypothetical protein